MAGSKSQSDTPSKPSSKPKQSRAIRTRENLMAALERLLREQEFEMISVQDIAKEAGVAVGSVYSHFKDKNAFLAALLDNWQAHVEAQLDVSEAQDVAAALKAFPSVEAALLDMTKQVHRQIVESGHVLRAVHTYTRLHPDQSDADWQSLVARSFAPMAALFEAFGDEITVSDTAQATRMIGYFFNTIFLRKALMPQDTLTEALAFEDETLIHEAAMMVYGYLTKVSTNASTSASDS